MRVSVCGFILRDEILRRCLKCQPVLVEARESAMRQLAEAKAHHGSCLSDDSRSHMLAASKRTMRAAFRVQLCVRILSTLTVEFDEEESKTLCVRGDQQINP